MANGIGTQGWIAATVAALGAVLLGYMVSVEGEPVRLTRREFELIQLLAAAGGRGRGPDADVLRGDPGGGAGRRGRSSCPTPSGRRVVARAYPFTPLEAMLLTKARWKATNMRSTGSVMRDV